MINSDAAATILAALRYFQKEVEENRGGADFRRYAKALMPEHFSEVAPLDAHEIDMLCETINLGDDCPAPASKSQAKRFAAQKKRDV